MSSSFHLHHFEVPMSISGQALLFGATSNILNPINKGQGPFQKIVGKPLRMLARLIYQIAIALIIAPLGAIYHFGSALGNWVVSRILEEERGTYAAFAWEHLKASGNELFFTLAAGGIFWINPKNSVSEFLSSSLVKAAPLLPAEERTFNGPFGPLITHVNFPKHLKNMHDGFYTFSELVFRALYLREDTGTMPRLDNREVRKFCYVNAQHGTYQ